MLQKLDAFIDQITMYKLLRYYLACLLLLALVLSFSGRLPFGPLALTVCTLLSLAVCWLSNKGLSAFFRAPTGSDSAIITSFILSLIITPGLDGQMLLFVTAAGILAMASKYVLAIRRKHIFNPAAIAVVLTSFGAMQTASWWVGSTVMLPFVIIGGLLIVHKIRRVRMVALFLLTTTAATALFTYVSGGDVLASMRHMALSSAIWFLGFIMLTEPATAPPTAAKRFWQAALVGVLLPPQVHILNFYSSPELALVIGNIFSYLVSPKRKLFPVLQAKKEVATDTVEFVFTPGAHFSYQPGQYVELTLPHTKVDARGDRRYFTLASSPTEPDIRFGIKFYKNGSSFKRALLAIDAKTPIVATVAAGDFTLPKNTAEKLAFIAGGIGITPFRSMVTYMIDKKEARDVALLYSARTQADVAYAPLLDEASQAFGMKTVYILTDEPAGPARPHMYQGARLTSELITKEIPDYNERTFYISGTHPMVESVRRMLLDLDVHRSRIKTDFFPGYV